MAAEAVWAIPERGDASVKAVAGVLLLYEDLGTALRAKQALDRLSGQLGFEAGWDTRVWRLDLLGEPFLAEQAAVEAAAADVIILSLHSRAELRAEVRDWLSRWLDHKEDRPYALAVLLDPEPAKPGTDHAIIAYLKRVAEAAQADLFCSLANVPLAEGARKSAARGVRTARQGVARRQGPSLRCQTSPEVPL